MRSIVIFLLFLSACFDGQKEKQILNHDQLNKIATDYVKLGLTIGQYDPDFVDAYYGPDSLKPITGKKEIFPKDSLLKAVHDLQSQLLPFQSQQQDSTLLQRAIWINGQLTAFGRRIKMVAGEKCSFDEQAMELFGVVPPTYTEDHFRMIVDQMDKLLPGKGSVSERFQSLSNRFIVPKDKLDTVLKTSIAESKRRTEKYIKLPSTENFKLEYVTGKSWSGYNWYQGKYQSLIQFNTDVTTFMYRVLDVASHEGYPGHHVYSSLLQEKIYTQKGWVEISLYALFSPQSLIAEGSANYGIEMAFPKEEKINFIAQSLAPITATDTAGLAMYSRALALKSELENVRTELTRRLLEDRMTDQEAVKWLIDYGLYNEKDAIRSVAFSRKNQSYVINYTYGMRLVKEFIENRSTDDDPEIRWAQCEWLLSNQVTPADLKQ